MIEAKIRNKIIEVLAPYSPKKIGIFGSYARGENNENSDIDILVDFKNTVNLLDLIGIEMTLSEQLGIKVDLITERSLNKSIRPYVEKDIELILND